MRTNRWDAPPDPSPALPPGQQPLYATFPRRLNALSVDALVVIAFDVGVFTLMQLLETHPPIPGVLLILLLLVNVLYEPVQVATFGRTIGHRAMNLHVVDDETGRPPTLYRAFLRTVAKAVVGILGFATMGRSRRHRAVHDMVTLTTVQIRDRSRARPHQYVLERPAPSGGSAPGRAPAASPPAATVP